MVRLASHQSPSSKLVHDLRNSLFAIDSAGHALAHLRPDEQEFAKVHESFMKQIGVMRDLLRKADEIIAVENAAQVD